MASALIGFCKLDFPQGQAVTHLLCPLSGSSTHQLHSLNSVPVCNSQRHFHTDSLCPEPSHISVSYYFSSDNLHSIFSPFLPSFIISGTQILFLSITFFFVSVYPDFGLALLDKIYLNRSTVNSPSIWQALS